MTTLDKLFICCMSQVMNIYRFDSTNVKRKERKHLLLQKKKNRETIEHEETGGKG